MLRDELEEIYLQSINKDIKKEYYDIVEKLKRCASYGLNSMSAKDLTDYTIERLTNEGIFIRRIGTLNDKWKNIHGVLYELTWM